MAMPKPGFDTRLESLRGLAALGVAWVHVTIAFVTTEPVNHQGWSLEVYY